MRRTVSSVAVALAFLLGSPAQAQVPGGVISAFIPSPLGIILTVGQWMLQDNKRVYYIRVVGEGATPEEARANGFRLAVEQAVGTIVLSETEVQNGRIKRDEIVSYASGFIDRFTIISTENQNNRVQVTMNIWVGESKIARRLLNESGGTGTIDGKRLAVQVDTLQQERRSGDQLLETVLRDFPKRAFTVQVEKTQIDFDTRRTLQIEIPWTVKWSDIYLDSLTETLRYTSQDRVSCWTTWSRDCLAQQARQFHFNGLSFNDAGYPMALIQHMAKKNKPAIRMAVVDAHGRIIQQACQRLLFSNIEDQPYVIPNRYFFTVRNNGISTDRSLRVSGSILMNFGTNTTALQHAERIEVNVVPESECPA